MLSLVRIGGLICLIAVGCAESAETPEVLVERGHLLENSGRREEAIAAYTKAIASRPAEALIYYDRGVAYGRLNQWDKAVADYSRAIELDPALARAYNNRAAAHAQQRQFAAAVADFSKTISLDSKSALAYRNRGLAYHDLGQLNSAIEDETVAIRLDPTEPEGYFERGNAFLESGQYQKAIVDFDKAISLDPARGAAWLNRGEAHRHLGNPNQAEADFKKAKQIDPKLVPSETVASQGLPEDRHSPETPSTLQARRERALRVAGEFLKVKGFQVQPAEASQPGELVAKKDGGQVNIAVRGLDAKQSALRFTREEIEAASRPDARTGLVIVGNLVPPKAAGAPFTGGVVIRFVEHWKPSREKLVPVVFEYSLPGSDGTPGPPMGRAP
jgi:tetratricopeptide (TPR) repeat protein